MDWLAPVCPFFTQKNGGIPKKGSPHNTPTKNSLVILCVTPYVFYKSMVTHMIFICFFDNPDGDIYFAICHTVACDNVFVLLMQFEYTIELLSGNWFTFVNHI